MTWPYPEMELWQFNMIWRIWFYVQHVVGYLKCVLEVCVFRGGGGGAVVT